MSRKVDVVIIGAGTAGLNAVSQVKRNKKSFVLVNGGELGTTCARVGCMPSKAMIHVANSFHNRKSFSSIGINGEEHLNVDAESVLKHTRRLRDYFVGFVLEDVNKLGDHFISGYAKFKDRNHLVVGDEAIEFKQAVIATGTQPIIPKDWQQFRDKLITTDEIFELEDLPKSIAVIGLGVIGLEAGQMLNRLGVKVSAFSRSNTIGKITDDVINKQAIDIFNSEYDLYLGEDVSIKLHDNNLNVHTKNHSVNVERALICIGRKPNLSSLDLESLNIDLNENGMPNFDKNTMQIEDTNFFIAGDVNKHVPILHEASDEGKIAGYNASASKIRSFKRKVPFSIIFSDPNIISVGENLESITHDDNYVEGKALFKQTGRPLIMGKDKGSLRIYVNKNTSVVTAAIMIGPHGENLAHLLVWAITEKMTVLKMLSMPYYHPVVEEFIKTALKNVLKKLDINNFPILGLEITD